MTDGYDDDDDGDVEEAKKKMISGPCVQQPLSA